jgi:hypothetical protein
MGNWYTDNEFLEVSTSISCPIACKEYCPQEVVVAKYFREAANPKHLTIDNWKIALSKLPEHLPIIFSGFCEPFANPECLDLIEAADALGHPVGLYSTFDGVTAEQFDRLLKVPLFNGRAVVWHLPDGKVAHINDDALYRNNFNKAKRSWPEMRISIMDDTFQSDNRENVARAKYPDIPKGDVHCHKWYHPQFVLLPNLDLQLCCMDWRLEHRVGNLRDNDYFTVRNAIQPSQPRRLCQLCNYSAKT